MYKQINADQIATTGDRDFNGADFSLGWSFLTEPFLMVAETHTHDFDQIIFLLGGDPANVKDFGAEIEMSLGEPLEKHLIDYTSCIYIPAGLMHCPLNVKSVNKPVMFIDITISPEASIRPLLPTSKRN
jgi:uncharacterized RmlC-like cupin family protein